jgi:hypothetical protein
VRCEEAGGAEPPAEVGWGRAVGGGGAGPAAGRSLRGGGTKEESRRRQGEDLTVAVDR